MMNHMFDELEKILSCELEVHETLVETAGAFNQSIRADNIPEIQTYTARHDEHICQVEKLEERRIEQCSILGKKLGLVSKEPRLSALIDNAPQEQKTRLLSIQKKLKSKINELVALTTSNRVLLENGLTVINNTFLFLQQSQRKFEPYSAKRKSSQPYQGYTLINRTV